MSHDHPAIHEVPIWSILIQKTRLQCNFADSFSFHTLLCCMGFIRLDIKRPGTSLQTKDINS